MRHDIRIAPPRKLDVRSAALQQACCSCGWRSGIGMRGKVNRDANQHARAMAQHDKFEGPFGGSDTPGTEEEKQP